MTGHPAISIRHTLTTSSPEGNLDPRYQVSFRLSSMAHPFDMLRAMSNVDTTLELIGKRRLPQPAARRALRMAAGLRLEDVAAACGVSLQAVWRWEHCQREPRTANRERYAEVLRACAEVVGE